MSLNPQQREAVHHTEGPLLILAGAGSGKTKTLTHRVAHLFEKGVPPENVLAVTFTQKAAEEMRHRIQLKVGEKASGECWIMTFHALCARILRECAVILPQHTETFSIYEPFEVRRTLKTLILRMGLNPKTVTPSGMHYYLSMLKNELIDPISFATMTPQYEEIDWEKASELIRTKIPVEKRRLVQELYPLYQTEMARLNAFDFDDLIVAVFHLFTNHPDALLRYQEQFRYIMVDEYQDTNHAQYVLIKWLSEPFKHLAVVGDDAQSIYAFRGSDMRNILRFDEDFPGARVVLLEENYRCSPVILQAANEVIAHNKNQRPKRLFTIKPEGEKIGYYYARNEYDEARFIVNEMRRFLQDGKRYSDFSVLYRTNQQALALQEAFMKMSVPYTVIGTPCFSDWNEMKDVVCFLKLLTFPDDLPSIKRVGNKPNRRLSPETFQAIEDGEPIALAREKNAFDHFTSLIKTHAKRVRREPLSVIMLDLLMETGYMQHYLDIGGEEQRNESLSIVMECLNVIHKMELQTDSFLSPQIASEHFQKREKLDKKLNENAVQMMTVHAAKGLEFDTVFLVGLEEGIFPHLKSSEGLSLEEERRLFYVAMTRAKQKLYISHSKKRTQWGKQEDSFPSRFLCEFSNDLLESGKVLH